MRQLRISILTIMLTAANFGLLPAASDHNFGARLAGSECIPSVNTRAQGQALFIPDDNGTSVLYKLMVSNCANILSAYVRLGTAGTDGPVVAALFDGPIRPGETNGILAQGNLTSANLTGPLAGRPLSALLERLRAGTAYVVVSTQQHPNGELRGQIR